MPQVHVTLLGEGVPVWRPARARHVQDSAYQLEGTVPEGEEWEFQPGELVKCELQEFIGGGSGLVARRPAA